jgi:hypothetical protein
VSSNAPWKQYKILVLEKKLKSTAEKLDLKIKQNSKKTDLVNLISNNVNNENLNTLLKEIGRKD